MEDKSKQLRKVSRCISTLLELEGITIQPNKVMDLIKDKDVKTNIQELKNEVLVLIKNSDNKEIQSTSVNRRKHIETFMVANWEVVKNNKEVKDILLNAYCLGRYTQEQRKQMKDNLLSMCNNSIDTTIELSKGLTEKKPKNNLKYDF